MYKGFNPYFSPGDEPTAMRFESPEYVPTPDEPIQLFDLQNLPTDVIERSLPGQMNTESLARLAQTSKGFNELLKPVLEQRKEIYLSTKLKEIFPGIDDTDDILWNLATYLFKTLPYRGWSGIFSKYSIYRDKAIPIVELAQKKGKKTGELTLKEVEEQLGEELISAIIIKIKADRAEVAAVAEEEEAEAAEEQRRYVAEQERARAILERLSYDDQQAFLDGDFSD